MTLSFARRFWMVALVLGMTALAPIRAGAEGILVFAAASLKTALDEIVVGYENQTGQSVSVSYAASSVPPGRFSKVRLRMCLSRPIRIGWMCWSRTD